MKAEPELANIVFAPTRHRRIRGHDGAGMETAGRNLRERANMAEIDRNWAVAMIQGASVAQFTIPVQTPAGRGSTGMKHASVIAARRQRYRVGDAGNRKRYA